MPTERLTNASIRAAIDRGTRAELPDPSTPGLHVLVTPAGAATFYVRYRLGGRRRRFKLGRWGRLTIEEARTAARRALADVDLGHDPQAARARSREALSLPDALARLLAEPGHRGQPRKPRTLALYEQLHRDHLEPVLGRVHVAAISAADVERVKVEAIRRVGVGRGHGQTAAVVANRTLALLSAILAAAERWGERPPGSNPCRGVKRYKEVSRKKYFRPEELASIASAIDRGEAMPVGVRGQKGAISPPYALALRLLLWTGCRTGEIRGLRWGMVDLESALLRLPDSKTGAKDVPLAAQAVDLLRRARARDLELHALVCATTRGGELRNLDRAWARIRKEAGVTGRKHDLRHTWVSVGVGAGVPLAVMGQTVGHASPSTTAIYAHALDEPLRQGVQLTAGAIEQALRDGAQVLRMPEPQREQAPARKRHR